MRAGPTDKAAVLRAQAQFRMLSPAAIEELSRYATPVRFRRGDTIFRKDDPPTCMYVVVDGAVRVSTVSAEGRTALLSLIGQNEIFGEIAVLDGMPRTTDVTANSDCELLAIERRDLLRFLHNQPGLALKFIELLCARLRTTNAHVEQVMLQNIPTRLANTLVRLAGPADGAATPPRIEMTQQQVSEMAGMSRESANKLLAVWAAEGWVRLEPGTVHVLQIDALRAVAGER
jgi:CRP/FNR family transcriptional regulator, cyclic AMP receptor protein